MKTLISIAKILTAPFWVPYWIQCFIIKKCWRFICLLVVGAIISGCASNSARFDSSPCAGCDFRPVNAIKVAKTLELKAQQKG